MALQNRSPGLIDTCAILETTYQVRYAGMRHGPPKVMARLAQGETVDPRDIIFVSLRYSRPERKGFNDQIRFVLSLHHLAVPCALAWKLPIRAHTAEKALYATQG